MTAPKVLFFDAAFTIIKPEPSVGELYARHAREYGSNVRARDLEAAFGPAWKGARDRAAAPAYGKTDEEARRFWREVVRDAFRETGAEMPEDPFFDDLFDAFGSAECWSVPEDVLPAVNLARTSGVKTGVLTNFDVRIHRILDELELTALFDYIIPSCEVGAEKPDKAIFSHAMREAGADEPATMALIGDSIDDDYNGAKTAGWQAALVDRRGAFNKVDVPIFSDLVTAVESLLK